MEKDVKKILTILILLFVSSSLFASISISVTPGVDLVHSRLFEEEIMFRTAGTIGLRADFLTWPSASFYINPYIRTDFTTHTLTFNNTRLVGSFDGAVGINANIKIKEKLDFSFFAGLVAIYYRSVPFSNIFWQITSDESKKLTFLALEAGSALIYRFNSVNLYVGSTLRYQRDSYHIIAQVGIGLEAGN